MFLRMTIVDPSEWLPYATQAAAAAVDQVMVEWIFEQFLLILKELAPRFMPRPSAAWAEVEQ